MLLDVPFVPDGEYPDFLADRAHILSSVHFSLSSPHLSDARQRMKPGDPEAILHGLRKLDGVKKYALMNARFHAPEKYFNAQGLSRTARLLENLLDEANLTGIVFADPYYLNALSDHAPDIASRLEAVPSINCQLDTPDKIFAMLAMIGRTGFHLPSRLVLDRSLNRNIPSLKDVGTRIKLAYPNMRLLLMANEGCLYQCPYKPTHDAHIGLVVEGLCGERTFAMNRDLGCIRRFLSDPGAMLTSPFIRPEDAQYYAGLADGLKLCGRTKGTPFLTRTISAYTAGRYTGNLLDLMDAMGDLSDRIAIPNEDLPNSFFERVTCCDKHCAACGWCSETVNRGAVRTDPGLPAHPE